MCLVDDEGCRGRASTSRQRPIDGLQMLARLRSVLLRTGGACLVNDDGMEHFLYGDGRSGSIGSPLCHVLRSAQLVCRGPPLPGGPTESDGRSLLPAVAAAACSWLAGTCDLAPSCFPGPSFLEWPAASRPPRRVNTWAPYNFATKVTSAKPHYAPLQNRDCKVSIAPLDC